MSEFLPLETLRNVKDLTLRPELNVDPQWPDSWYQLTSMTRLELDCKIELECRLRALLHFRIKSLIDIGSTAYNFLAN